MVCVFVIIIVPAYLASNANKYYYGASNIFNEETQLGKDIASIEKVFGQRDTYVLLVPRGDTATETKLSDELHELPEITGIISYVDMAGAEIPLEYLAKPLLPVFYEPDNFLYCIPYYQLHSARGNSRLCNPYDRQV